ncbi:MAG: hypothetical protein SGI71_10530 [Verrucomicrobiota bacterium]|nr:hypothetical protein [Verrucomicrobiota bacterium]
MTLSLASLIAGAWQVWIQILVMVSFALVVIAACVDVFSNVPAKTTILPNVIILLIALGVVLGFFTVPAERVIGRDDQGTYSNAAINIARTQTYKHPFPVLSALPQDARAYFLMNKPITGYAGNREFQHHIGWRIQEGSLVPMFPPVYSLWLAGFYATAGWIGMEYQGTLLLVATGLMLGWMARPWLGFHPACLLIVAWWLNPLTLWFSRTYYAENLLLIWWLLIVGLMQIRTNKALWVASMMAGMAPLIKVEGLLIPVGLMGLSIFRFVPYKIILTGVLAGASVTGMWFASSDFSYLISSCTMLVGGKGLVLVVGLLMVGVAGWFRETLLSFWTKHEIKFLASLVLILVYAAFIRPYFGTPHTFYYWPVESVIESWREHTFNRIGWYLSHPGLILACLGIFVALRKWKDFTPDKILFFGVGFIALLLICYDLRNAPVQPYAMRRLLVFGWPLLMVACLQAVRYLPKVTWASTVIVSGLLLLTLPLNLDINTKLVFPHIRNQIETLASHLPPNAVILTGDDEPGTFLVSPLSLLANRPTFALTVPNPQSIDAKDYNRVVAATIDSLTHSGYRVFFLTEQPHGLIPPQTPVKPVFKAEIKSQYFIQNASHLITETSPWEYQFAVFEVQNRP